MDDNPFGDPEPVRAAPPPVAAPAAAPARPATVTSPTANAAARQTVYASDDLLPLLEKIKSIVRPGSDDLYSGSLLRPLLLKAELPVDQLKQVWSLSDATGRGSLDASELKIALQLIALAQCGEPITVEQIKLHRGPLVPMFNNIDAPIPAAAPAAPSARQQARPTSTVMTRRTSADLLSSFSEVLDRETVTVVISERAASMFATTFYTVTSRAHGSTVVRRYSDFDWLHEQLLRRYPFRIIPELPAKKIINKEDDLFIEQRRRGLVRFLEFVGRHPVLRNDETIITFLREENNDAFASFKKLKAAQVIEELSFNPIALSSKEHTPVDADDALRAAREKVPSLILTFAKYVETVESMVKRIQGDAVDYMKMGQLQQIIIELEYPSQFVNSSRVHKYITSRFEDVSKVYAENAVKSTDLLLEALKHHLSVMHAFQELFVRRQTTTQKDHLTLQRRIATNKAKLSQAAAAGKTGRALDSISEEIERDEREAELILKRDDFATYCLWKELQFFNQLKAYFTINLQELVRTKLQFSEQLVSLFKQLQPLVDELPAAGFL